jgi:hypothetical protein
MELLGTLYNGLLEYLIAIVASPLGPWLVVVFVATAATFFRTAWDRVAIDRAVAADGAEPLDLLDLSRGDAARAMEHKASVPPERLWTYDEEYLERFVRVADQARIGQRTALDLYLKSTLPWDMAFAFFLALFVALFWFSVASAYWAPLWLARLALLYGCMGIVYGVADVAEDLKLASTLRYRTIDPAEAAAANVLTRIKLVTIVFSIVGALVFATLSAVTRLWLELDELLERVFAVAFAWVRGVRAARAGRGEYA